VDVLIDDQLTPWLVEFNTSPSLSSSSPLDKRIKNHLISNLFNLVGFVPYSRSKLKELTESEKKQRRIFKHPSQSTLKPKRCINTLKTLSHKSFIQHLTEKDWRTIHYLEDENVRSGNFTRIFPTRNTLEQYSKYMESVKYNNLLVGKWLLYKQYL
jgi:hypothetical protein